MANFTPTGIIKIGRVPFDNSYRHTLTFDNVNDQTSYFSSCCDENLSGNDYTYVRMNNAIRVPYNAERLYTYNYVMYQNANYGTKWFYAFITGINYINENVTELQLQLDVMQTWYFDYTLKSCFVEREHVNDDTVGAHLNAEPGMDLQYIHRNFTASTYHLNDCWICLMVTQYPCYSLTTLGGTNTWTFVARDSEPCAGDIYMGNMNGCKPLIYDPTDTDSMDALLKDLEQYNLCGAADGIVDGYLIPKIFLPQALLKPLNVKVHGIAPLTPEDRVGSADRPNVYTVRRFMYGNEHTFYMDRPYDLANGYHPRNNKLLCYPYTYLEIGDFTGRVEDYHWEYFNLSDGQVVINERAQGISDCQAYIIPRNYDGAVGEDGVWKPYALKPFTYDFTTKISWVYSVYQNWLAQNAITNNLTVLGSIGAMAVGLGPGISAASSILGKGANVLARHVAAGNTNAAAKTIGAYGGAALSTAAKNTNEYMTGGGLAGLGSVIGNVEKMHRTPNQARGNISGNSKFQNGYSGWYMSNVSIREEFARIMDDFFDCYGYSIERHKVPNRHSRRYWNYIKTQNADHYGNVPSEDMAQINQIYDSGITFWHPYKEGNNWIAPVGDYSLSNVII